MCQYRGRERTGCSVVQWHSHCDCYSLMCTVWGLFPHLHSRCVIPHLCAYLLALKLLCLPLTISLSPPASFLSRPSSALTLAHLASVGSGWNKPCLCKSCWMTGLRAQSSDRIACMQTHTHTYTHRQTLSLEKMSQRERPACFHSNESTCHASFGCLNPPLKSRVQSSEGAHIYVCVFNYKPLYPCVSVSMHSSISL